MAAAAITSLRNYELLPVWKQRTRGEAKLGNPARGGADEFMIGTRQASQMLLLPRCLPPRLWSMAFLIPIPSGLVNGISKCALG